MPRLLLLACPCLLLACPPVQGADPDEPVQPAIEKAVKYLAGLHKPGRDYASEQHGVGVAALSGLGLLSAGMKGDDPIVGRIASFVRSACFQETKTYELSLIIMFLDRLGTPADRGLIQYLGARLLAGQEATGMWGYTCPYRPDADEERRLRSALLGENRLTTPGAGGLKPTPKERPADTGGLHPEAARLLKLVNEEAGRNRDEREKDGDHSNTQFATMGVWCARKHGLPAEDALKRLDRHYRECQQEDGGWGYKGWPASRARSLSTPAMTCAGLMGLAAGLGAQDRALRTPPAGGGWSDLPEPKGARPVPPVKDAQPPAPVKDAVIDRGLVALGKYLSDSKGADAPKKGRGKFRLDALGQNQYFLWAMERVGVMYGLDTIGGHDWYSWGAQVLLDTQAADGSWPQGQYPGAGPELNTAQALLFLARANLAPDLSASLKGRVSDPGTSRLKGTGVLPGIVAAPPKPAEPVVPPPMPEPSPAPPPPTDAYQAERDRLVAGLVQAAAADRADALARLRDAKGGIHTDALARAIPQLPVAAADEAREALARRLTRMTATTLADMLTDPDREIRRAAATACGLKGNRDLVPVLIDRLKDPYDPVVKAVRGSLRTLTGQDFGPEPRATFAERDRAVVRWRAWWEANK